MFLKSAPPEARAPGSLSVPLALICGCGLLVLVILVLLCVHGKLRSSRRQRELRARDQRDVGSNAQSRRHGPVELVSYSTGSVGQASSNNLQVPPPLRPNSARRGRRHTAPALLATPLRRLSARVEHRDDPESSVTNEISMAENHARDRRGSLGNRQQERSSVFNICVLPASRGGSHETGRPEQSASLNSYVQTTSRDVSREDRQLVQSAAFNSQTQPGRGPHGSLQPGQVSVLNSLVQSGPFFGMPNTMLTRATTPSGVSNEESRVGSDGAAAARRRQRERRGECRRCWCRCRCPLLCVVSCCLPCCVPKGGERTCKRRCVCQCPEMKRRSQREVEQNPSCCDRPANACCATNADESSGTQTTGQGWCCCHRAGNPNTNDHQSAPDSEESSIGLGFQSTPPSSARENHLSERIEFTWRARYSLSDRSSENAPGVPEESLRDSLKTVGGRSDVGNSSCTSENGDQGALASGSETSPPHPPAEGSDLQEKPSALVPAASAKPPTDLPKDSSADPEDSETVVPSKEFKRQAKGFINRWSKQMNKKNKQGQPSLAQEPASDSPQPGPSGLDPRVAQCVREDPSLSSTSEDASSSSPDQPEPASGWEARRLRDSVTGEYSPGGATGP